MNDFFAVFSEAWSLIMENTFLRLLFFASFILSLLTFVSRFFLSFLSPFDDVTGLFSEFFSLIVRWCKSVLLPLVVRFLVWTKIIVKEDQ